MVVATIASVFKFIGKAQTPALLVNPESGREHGKGNIRIDKHSVRSDQVTSGIGRLS